MELGDVRVESVGGEALDEATRVRLEGSFGTDLSAIRIHADGTADRFARELRTDAFAAGTHLFFRAGAYRPGADDGLRLLAHEVTHAVQQQTTAGGREAEVEAERAAASVLACEPVDLAVRPGALRDEAPRAIQRHESFEHRSLGDVPTQDIHTLALRTDKTKFEQIIERETALMWLWHQNPESVKPADITASCPWIRTITLPSTGLLVTYGELNALPDYIASAQAIDTCPKDVLLAILQSIRQETFVQLNALRGKIKKDQFQYAPFGPNDWQIGLLNKIFNTWALDDTTKDLGTNGIDHYSGLLARNACHFAPYTWYRWQAAYLIAVDLAKKAHAAGENKDGPLTVQAWTYHGYADHFLQDSFAAGHLINKTLVMQWFVKWADSTSLPIEDWALIKDMTPALQPALGSAQLYGGAYHGPGTDPQTVEEQATYDLRLALSGVTAYKDPGGTAVDQKAAYQRYLAFLSSVVTQAASNAMHDAFNERSLWVASEAIPTPYKVFGDDTLFTGDNGSDGARITSEAAQRSQQSIHELLKDGNTAITSEEIRRHFPTRAGDTAATVDTLEKWAFGQEQWAIDNVFSTAGFGAKRIATQLFPRLLNFSKDQEFANRWYANLTNSGYHFADVVMAGDRLFASSNGQGYELRPANGEVIHQWTIRSNTMLGDPFEMHLATDGSRLYAGHPGYLAAFNLDSLAWAWTAPMTGLSSWPVGVLCAGGRVFAGSNGSVHEINPATGARLRSLDVSQAYGADVHLATDGTTLFAGCHGYVHGVLLNDWSKIAWTTPMTGASYSSVAVLYQRGMLFAGSNGSVHQLDPSTGARSYSLGLSAAVNEDVRMTATDQRMLVAGCHGYAYGINLNDWSKLAWTTPMAGKLYKMVDVTRYGDKVYAVSNGYAHRLNPVTGEMLNALQLSNIAGSGDYTPALAVNPKWGMLVGMHGYVYSMLL